MTAAREEMGVLKQRMAAMAAALEDQKRVSEGLVEKAKTSVKALATQQQINAGVMRLKNDAEWRMLEMRAAFERAGLEPPGIESAEIEPKPSTPRLAGRPGPAERAGRQPLGAVPAADARTTRARNAMPISPGRPAPGRESMRAAGACPRARRWRRASPPRSEYAREFAFEEEPGNPARAVARGRPRNSRPRSGRRETVAGETVAREALGGRGARRLTPRAPRARRPEHAHRPWLRTRDTERTARRRRRRPADEQRDRSSPTKPTARTGHPLPARRPPKQRLTALAEAPAWGASPSKGKFRDDRAAADAVAEARRRRRRSAQARRTHQEVQN